MDQIQMARIIALLTILPPEHEFCKLVKEFAESDSRSDIDKINKALSGNNDLKKRLDEAAFAVYEFLDDWEAEIDEEDEETKEEERPTLVQMIQRIAA